MNNILKYIGIIALCVLFFVIGRWGVQPSVVRQVKVDTISIEKPIPYEVKVAERVNVPVYIKVPADTVYVTQTDSILVKVPVEMKRLEYQDEWYKAVVSGPAIGDMHPKLEDIDIYAKTETVTIEKSAPLFRPYISACAGKNIVGVGGGVHIRGKALVGAKYMRIGDENTVVGEIGWTF